jgi:serine/threonine-protein kinase
MDVRSSSPDLPEDEAADLVDPLIQRARGRLGQVLNGKWHLDVLLGVGGMAAVYAATHRNGSRAAVKLLHPELSLQMDVRRRFQREGYIANAVGHGGAVKVLDDDVAEDGSFFLVTELLDGETADDRRVRAGGRLPEDEVLCIVDRVLDVLVAAHGRGVVHRDLKPDNVFVTRDGSIKVLDFGIARLRENSGAGPMRTQDGTMGTPAFMSPEQARGVWDEVDGRTDLWAIGATMFNLLTGGLVHVARSPNERLYLAMTHVARPLTEVLPDATPAVAEVVDRALAFQRDARWPDATQMQEAVRRAYHECLGKPISAAAPLAVPASVADRTLGHGKLTGSMALPTTARPVETAPYQATRSRRPLVRTVGGVAAVSVVVGMIAALALPALRSSSKSPAVLPPAAEVSTAAAATASVASSAAAPGDTPTPPEVAATDLPIVPATLAPASRPPVAAPRTLASAEPSPRSAAAASPGPAPAPPACNPPFTIDPANGKKHFKVECL